ncbi:MAG: GNAT family N-acetyltransferase [Verrucomicrobiota bacterium]
MTTALTYRHMTRPEVDILVSWAADEGWNPGLHDAEPFWVNDPDAFIAAEREGELIGGGSITAYGDEYGFMGFFIVRPEFRGRGWGDQIWHERLRRMKARLKGGASIGLDGVFDMQGYYAKGGFVFSHRNLRCQAEIPVDYCPPPEPLVVPLQTVPFEQVAAYDRACFPAERTRFLEQWIGQPDCLSLGYLRDHQLAGFGVIRRCGVGCKIGPFFVDNAKVGDALYRHLATFAAGTSLFLDVPENNRAAMALVKRYDMAEVFGCARMYIGPVPDIAHERVFGVTTFEAG